MKFLDLEHQLYINYLVLNLVRLSLVQFLVTLHEAFEHAYLFAKFLGLLELSLDR